MFGSFKAWLNPPPQDDAATVRDKLRGRCNAEIVARLRRRAEIHEQRGGYVARCSPMDVVAAERISDLERMLALAEGRSIEEFDGEVHRMLAILREP
jgi:hypothetical protein